MAEKVKILIADSGCEYGGIIYRRLESEGYEYKICADDGYELLSRISEYEPDAVLCDLFMTGTDAVGVIKKANKGAGRKIFFIVTSFFRECLFR